jgi:hypothetical protein
MATPNRHWTTKSGFPAQLAPMTTDEALSNLPHHFLEKGLSADPMARQLEAVPQRDTLVLAVRLSRARSASSPSCEAREPPALTQQA